jgi:hypothetical protein
MALRMNASECSHPTTRSTWYHGVSKSEYVKNFHCNCSSQRKTQKLRGITKEERKKRERKKREEEKCFCINARLYRCGSRCRSRCWG